MKIDSSPVYLDTSAAVKLYVPEPESDALERAVLGRNDLILSELAVTELTGTITRAVRERRLSSSEAIRVYALVLRHAAEGRYQRAELTEPTHREAERLLVSLGPRVPLRAADALHLALASLASARVLVTYDRRLHAAAVALGTLALPALSAG